MRLRNISGSREMIADSKYVIQDAENQKGKIKTYFEKEQPIRIEIGMGKGRFIMQMAEENPEINFIGIEKYSSVLLRAIQKMEQNELPKLRFIRMDADDITEVFEKGEVDRIFLNFSDPWPKARHARRRLTSTEFLGRYNQVLASEGQVEFKTDNEALFDFSLESVEEAGWKLTGCSRDLHHDPSMNAGNIMTEYEEKFSSKGNPIYKLLAVR